VAGHLTAIENATVRLEAVETGIEEIEIRLLLEGIRLCYGYDFREYALKPLRRSIIAAIAAERLPTVSAYQDRILHDASCMTRLLSRVGVSVTSMFREVELMRCVRAEVVPVLRTYPSVRVWMVGCATGEEVYSMAILLQEEGVLRRAGIYATDLNEDPLAVARTGVYPIDRIRSSDDRYAASGGQRKLSDYYTVSGKTARFNSSLRNSITWARHNLVTDASFNEFNLIVCANVLIYFRPSLQEKAHRLFADSLVRSGFLALGKGESLVFSPESSRYQQVRDGVSLFRKVRW
jgi:chemotaxis protein methyltransferase CheR